MNNTKKINKLLSFGYTAVLLLIFLVPTSSLAKVVGPYTGQVLDSRTGEPIQGASVLIYWEKRIPAPPSGGYSELVKITLVYTDDQGMYRIPRQFINTGLIGLLESTNLVIYQPGYQAFTDRKWQGDLPAPFQKDTIVKLERIPPGFDHQKHHERITDALRGIDIDYYEGVDNLTGRALSTEEIVEKIAIMAEYWEFLRRVEWEEKREIVK